MNKLNIKLDFEFTGSKKDLENEIIERAAELISINITTEADSNLKSRVKSQVDAAIEKLIEQLIVKEIPLYSSYGEPKNKTTTIKEMLFEAAQASFVRDRVGEHALKAVRSDEFRKKINVELVEIREKYEVNLKHIITESIEKFIKEFTKK